MRTLTSALRPVRLITLVALASIASLSTSCEDGYVCGPGTEPSNEGCVPKSPGPLLPTVQSVGVSSLSLDTAGEPLYLLYPVHVTGSLTVLAEELTTDVSVALESASAGTGCVLGSFSLDHVPTAADPSVAVAHDFDERFRIPGECQALVGKTDVVAFVAFDPFHQILIDGRPELGAKPPNGTPADPTDAEEGDGTSFDLVQGSRVASADGCVGCATQSELRASPGKDVELLGTQLASSVAIIDIAVGEVPAQTEQEIIDANAAFGLPVPAMGEIGPSAAMKATVSVEPHFSLTASFRTRGLDLAETQLGSAIGYKVEIRPLPGGINSQAVAADQLDFVPLSLTPPSTAATITNGAAPDHKGSDEPSIAAGVYIAGDAYNRMATGTWRGLAEFELRFCLVPSFTEASIAGNTEAQGNNCTSGPVVITRRTVSPAGAELNVADGNVASSWERQLAWQKLWGSKSKASAELAFWLTMGFTSNTGATSFGLGGSTMTGKGGWYEAGARATACVFNGCADLAKAQVTMKDYQDSADSFFMEGRILIFDFLPRVYLVWPDGTLTLKQVLTLISNAKGKEYKSTLSFEYEIIGKKFNIPVINKTIEASVKAFVDMGLDDGDTAIKKEAIAPEGDPCMGKTVVNGQCFAMASTDWHNTSTLAQRCTADFGQSAWPAIIRDSNDLAAATNVAGLTTSFLIGSVYTGNGNPIVGSLPGGKLSLYKGPSDNFASSLLNGPWIPGSPSNDSPGAHQMVQYNATPYMAEPGLASLLMTARVKKGMCSIRQQVPTLGGSKITVTIVPFVAAGVRATLKADLGALKAFAEGTLNIIKVGLEFLGSLADRFRSDQKVAIELGRSITLKVSVLSGNIDVGASLNFKAPCIPKFWKICKYKISGSVTILSWSGFVFNFPILALETSTYLL